MMLSTGIAMEIHYCMGKKAGVDFYAIENEKCRKCGMKEKKNGCCSDEHKFYKFNNSFKISSNNINFLSVKESFVSEYPVFNWQTIQITKRVFIKNYSPPDITRPSICIKNCVFRI